MAAHTLTSFDPPAPTPVAEGLGYEFGAYPSGGVGFPGDGPWGSYRTATGGPIDRQYGRNLPVFWTEIDLRWYRIIARHLDSTNNFAIGFLNHLTNYHVRKGFSWQACRHGVKKTPYQTVGAPEDKLVGKGQQILDRWRDQNLWPLVSREAFRVWRREGEVFGRFFRPRWNLLPDFRLVGNELIGNPTGDSNGPDSYGIRTAPDDVTDVLAVHVFDPDRPGEENEWVDADRMVRATCNVDRHCVKRGVPDFLPMRRELEGIRSLLYTMLDTSNKQAQVAWIEQFPTALADTVRNEIPRRPTAEVPAYGPGYPGGPGGPWGNSIYSPTPGVRPGYVLKAEGSRVFAPGPASASVGNWLQVEAACLRSCASRWGMPENFVGDASNANMASLIVAGSPFVVAVEGCQLEWNLLWERPAALKVLDLAVDAGLLTPDERRQLDVEVTEPNVISPEPDKDAARVISLTGAKILSQTTAQQQLGLDPQHEAANMQAEAARQPQQPGGGRDDGQGDGTGDDTAPDQGGGDGAMELLGLSEGKAGLVAKKVTVHRKDGTTFQRTQMVAPDAPAPQKKQAKGPQPASAGGTKSGTLVTPQVRAKREIAAKTVGPPKYVPPPPEPKPSPAAEAALKAAPKIGVNEQSYAEDYNEVRMATLLGGGSFPDSEECDLKIAADPAVGERWSAQTRAYREQMTAWKDGGKKGRRPELPPLEGEVKHLCEMKTPVVGRGGISMNAYAIVRKVLLERASGKPYHTIVCDHRGVFNANGPGDHGDPDDEVIYYRRGVGNAVIPDPDDPGSGSLYRCKDRAELERLMDLPDDALPAMAKRRDQEWHRGTWRPLKGERGYVRADGYKLDENGEPLLGPDGKKQVKLQIVRPKP